QADGRILMPVLLSDSSIAGNWIALQLDDGRYALYAHLQPGTIRVEPSQRVHRGDVLASLGNSGNSVGPHLHFQLSTEPAFNIGEGLPFTFAPSIAGVATRLGGERLKPTRSFVPVEGALLWFPDK